MRCCIYSTRVYPTAFSACDYVVSSVLLVLFWSTHPFLTPCILSCCILHFSMQSFPLNALIIWRVYSRYVHSVWQLIFRDCFFLPLSDAGHSAHHTPVPSKCEGGAAALPVRAPQAGRAHAASCVGPAALSAAKIRPTGSWKSPGLSHRPVHARTWTEGHQARVGAVRKKVKHII